MQLTAASHLQYQDGNHAWSCCFPTPTAWGAGKKKGGSFIAYPKN